MNPGYRLGAREALGTPAAVLAAGYVGYGALSSDVGFSLWATLLSTAAIWALPGQLILVEMSSSGAPLFAILLAVAFSAVRFLPMTVSLLPALRAPAHGRAKEFLAAHLIAMTGWIMAMRRTPELPVADRLPYFIGFALALWLVSIAATGAGFLIAGSLPPVTKSAFVFMNPVYFLLLMLSDARTRVMALSLAGGAVCGPLIYLLAPQWSVLGGGLIGGTAAFAIHRYASRHD
ncbi:AzlC family ABC transporter permease [Burkholderiaceae bacterium FT117]|uniref:AzlC family ABC transporter permease n=1 Tax=Zeimonas sediminis TaxID=2944268 RepID=UPI002342FDEF|nr:AzlC family ABC transporter permease [Zeimonas sediminis]MCM5570337.1 AzlC family ABC transporter permease [Zeimonas sediminis]